MTRIDDEIPKMPKVLKYMAKHGMKITAYNLFKEWERSVAYTPGEFPPKRLQPSVDSPHENGNSGIDAW